MRAAYASAPHPDDPLAGLVVDERPEPVAPSGWTAVAVKAASLNHHDLWTLRGVGISEEQFPMILGCDAAGIDASTGAEVVVHSVIATEGWDGDETLDPKRNVLPKPAELSWAEAACLPTAWLTAYRMLFVRSGLRPGQTVLVQGASGGVATAAIMMGRAAGLRVWATSRDEAKQAAAVELGAHQAFASGARLPERVDAVIETVGAATWSHSLKSLRPGGRVVISGATSGAVPPADLTRVFFLQLSVVGSTMGTRDQFGRLLRFCEQTGVRPLIDTELPLDRAREGFAAMLEGDLFGKIVFTL